LESWLRINGHALQRPIRDGNLPRLDGEKTMEMAFGFQLMLRVMFGIYMHRRSLTWSKVTTVDRGSAFELCCGRPIG